jgi:hypothetical protein
MCIVSGNILFVNIKTITLSILVTFYEYPDVLETIHVKLLVEAWSVVQALRQGLLALLT